MKTQLMSASLIVSAFITGCSSSGSSTTTGAGGSTTATGGTTSAAGTTTTTTSTGSTGAGGAGGTGGAGGNDITSVTMSAQTAFATLASGKVIAWGANPYGILGVLDATDPGSEAPHEITGLAGKTVTQLVATRQNVFALLADGTVLGWGSNIDGLLGTGDNGDPDDHIAPAPIPGLTDVASLASNTHALHMCALKKDKTVWCWGRNVFLSSGQPQAFGGCGPDPAHLSPCVSKPTQVAGITGARSVHIGEDYSCYVKDTDGSLSCWGSNLSNELGTDNTADQTCVPGDPTQKCRLTPTPVPGINNPKTVQLAGDSSCVLSAAGKVTCWGSNTHGDLGIGSAESGPFPPTEVPGLDNVVQFGHASSGIQISASCALRQDGTTVCWGDNLYSTLGQSGGTLLESNAPITLDGLTDPVTLYFSVHPCATVKGLAADKLLCWGANGSGQSGQSASNSTVDTPTEYDPTP